MVSSDFRAKAREKLTGKWGKAVLITLLYFILFSFISVLQENTTGFPNLVVSVLLFLIQIPLGFGLVACFVNLFNGKDVKVYDFLSFGFDNFGKSWEITLRTVLKLLLPFIVLIISIVPIIAGTVYYTTTANIDGVYFIAVGIILYVVSFIWLIFKSYYYDLTYIIATEHPEMSSKEIVAKSEELMQNNRLKLFCLEVSFIGWAILATLLFGIGMLWLAPYMQFARISFYKNLINN